MLVVVFDLFVESFILLHCILQVCFIFQEIAFIYVDPLNEESGLFEVSDIAHVLLDIIEDVLAIERPVPAHPVEQSQEKEDEKDSDSIESVHDIGYILINEKGTFDVNGSRESKEHVDTQNEQNYLTQP